MVLNPATNRQVPDHSILDNFGKQTYLGNSYVLPASGVDLPNDDETPIALIINPSVPDSAFPSGYKGLFIQFQNDGASSTAFIRYYINPTIASIGVQSITTVADISGSLNSTYFTFGGPTGTMFYVWFNINSAGVDPAPPGLTGIEVSAATNASADTLATDIKNAINASVPAFALFSAAVTTDVVTLTSKVEGPFVPAADSAAAPTEFTFELVAGYGLPTTALNLRPASPNISIAQCYLNPAPTDNGTLYMTIGEEALISVNSNLLIIIDPGYSLLITAQQPAGSDGSIEVFSTTSWAEI